MRRFGVNDFTCHSSIFSPPHKMQHFITHANISCLFTFFPLPRLIMRVRVSPLFPCHHVVQRISGKQNSKSNHQRYWDLLARKTICSRKPKTGWRVNVNTERFSKKYVRVTILSRKQLLWEISMAPPINHRHWSASFRECNVSQPPFLVTLSTPKSAPTFFCFHLAI